MIFFVFVSKSVISEGKVIFFSFKQRKMILNGYISSRRKRILSFIWWYKMWFFKKFWKIENWCSYTNFDNNSMLMIQTAIKFRLMGASICYSSPFFLELSFYSKKGELRSKFFDGNENFCSGFLRIENSFLETKRNKWDIDLFFLIKNYFSLAKCYYSKLCTNRCSKTSILFIFTFRIFQK